MADALNSFLGASPDRTVNCSCHVRSVVEIKCPYNYKNGFEGWRGDEKFPHEED